jgi:putative protein-disulfide isomerase
MAEKTRATYLFDPLCGWCYGAAPTLMKLATHPEFMVKLAPVGLFSGDGARPMDEEFADYAWAHDQRIARLSGQRFTEQYRLKVLGDHTRLLDSGPATLALTAVALTEPARELEALKAIQEARYVSGRDITELAVLASVLETLGLHTAARRISAPDEELLSANRKRVATGRAEMERVGAKGVPALIVGEGATRQLLGGITLYTRIEDLVASLRAS